MSLLKIIDNPINDIALVTVLRSMIGNFTDNELIKIRIAKPKGNFYEAMCAYKDKEDGEKELIDKINTFLDMIENFRKCEEYMPLNEFIWKIYQDTGYYSYVNLMPNGLLRVANLKLLFEKAKQYEKTSFKGLYNFISFIEKLSISNKDMSGAKLIGENEDVIRIMSIHKSKGLEFPVVFISNTNRKFNVQDLNKSIVLLHQDIGIGSKYINYEEGITYSTLAREAIRYKSKIEQISEEMRILYVGLTRAKEKLIITGLSKDYQKDIKEKEILLNTYRLAQESNKIDKNIIQKYDSYLDWLELVYTNSDKELKEILNVEEHKKEELLKSLFQEEKEEKLDLQDKIDSIELTEKKNLKEKLEWEYEGKIPNNILSKSSVTQVKNMKLDLEEEEIAEYKVPEFLEEEKTISASQKGTLMHLILQKLDEKIDYDISMLKQLIDNLQEKNIITEKEKEAVDIEKVYEFTKTNIWHQMKTAKKVEKEKPFYINIPAKEIYNENIEENILVQGIIDLYYITEDDKLVLVDYKTDKVEKEAELVEKYKTQLDIYKKALEKALNRKVESIYIYSVYLSKEIEV